MTQADVDKDKNMTQADVEKDKNMTQADVDKSKKHDTGRCRQRQKI